MLSSHRTGRGPNTSPAAIARGNVRPNADPAVAGLLSSLLPGAGQLYTGRRARGFTMLAVTALLTAGGLWLWRGGPIALLALAVRPRVLAVLLAANAVVLLFRLFSVSDAYRSVSPSRVRSRATLVLLIVLTAMPHVAAGYYDLLTMDLLDQVFSADRGAVPATGTLTGDYKLTIPVTPRIGATPVPSTGD